MSLGRFIARGTIPSREPWPMREPGKADELLTAGDAILGELSEVGTESLRELAAETAEHLRTVG